MGRYQQLNATKQQQQQQSAGTTPPVDAEVLHHAQQFIKDNNWYDPQGRDEDSSIVLAIDAALGRDGFDPRSADYWDELKRRAARRLPERFSAAAAANRQPRGGPAVGSGREHAPESTRREVYISPERKQALIEAGADALFIDAATGHTRHVMGVIEKLRSLSAVPVVAGNVVTEQGARDLVKAGANAIKVGVGPGSICTTRVISGVGMPQFTAIRISQC